MYFTVLCFITLSFFGCTEPFELKTETFEDILVIEATITDEFKRQEIKLSRTFPLESNEIVIEKNAKVIVEEGNQNRYNFTERSNGVYVSDTPFKAIEEVSYKLEITTQSGKQYSSREELLAPRAQINNLYAELETIEGQLGIQIYIDTNEDLGSAKFFRYEYDETYKIMAPNFTNFDVDTLNFSGSGEDIMYDVVFLPRLENQKVCYSSKQSNNILLTNTDDISENTIVKFPVRFISANNPILRERYSILVRQYVQSADASNFYKILKDLGSDESLLVDNQPGFVQGNIFSQQNFDEKVIGFFDISPVTSERIYFNYNNFNLDLPPYFFDCEFIELDYKITGPPEPNERLLLYQLMVIDGYKYVSDDDTVYTMVRSECGDCTTFASNIKPEFWID